MIDQQRRGNQLGEEIAKATLAALRDGLEPDNAIAVTGHALMGLLDNVPPQDRKLHIGILLAHIGITMVATDQGLTPERTDQLKRQLSDALGKVIFDL